jgi:hypothetical protein
MSPRGIASWSRETRLLILTIALSVAALLILARFRFPAQQRIEPTPQPLERLAARATYDELASIVQRIEQRISPSLLVLRARTRDTPQPRALSDVLAGSDVDHSPATHIVALRVRPDVAIARMSAGTTVEAILGHPEAVPLLLAADPIRQIALIRVPPPAPGADWRWTPVSAIQVPRYVVAVEASRGGATPRPVFLGRADRIDDPRWQTSLIVLARTPVAADGALVFSLEGELIGLVAPESGVLAVVPAETLVQTAERLLESGSPGVADFGITLQPLTGEHVRTLGVTSGVVVHGIARDGRADGRLRAGDLIVSIDGRPAVYPDNVLLQLARTGSSDVVRLVIRRGEETLSVEIPPQNAAPDVAASKPAK